MEAPLEFLNGVRDIPTNGYRPRAAEQTQLCHARCKPQAPPKQVKQTLRLGFNFYCRLRCSMELAAVSLAPWVGHVVVPKCHDLNQSSDTLPVDSAPQM